MKKSLKIGLVSMILALCIGGAVAIKANPAPKEADAVNLPTLNVGTINQFWRFDSDPAGGTTAFNASNKSTGTNLLSTRTGSDSTYQWPYIEVYNSSYIQKFVGQYTPFSINITVSAFTFYEFSFDFRMYVDRAASGGGADYSNEFFYFGETQQTPTSFFYIQDDFRNSTGAQWSQYRIAKGDRSEISYDLSLQLSTQNTTGSNITKTFYFGFMSYMEQSGTDGKLNSKIYLKDFRGRSSEAGAFISNGIMYRSTEFGTALSTFNGGAGRTLQFLQDFSWSASHIVVSQNGTINLNGHTLTTTNDKSVYLRGNVTINGAYGSKITSATSFATVVVDSANTSPTISGSVVIENTSNNSQARAILLNNVTATLTIDSNAQVTGAVRGVQIDYGTLKNKGYIMSPTTTGTAIYCGTSSDTKNVYMLEAGHLRGYIVVNSVSTTFIYATDGSTPLTSTDKINVQINDSNAKVGDVIVRGVNNTNYVRFSLLWQVGYSFVKNGTNLIIGYTNYTITFSLTNSTFSGSTTANKSANYSCILYANDGYYITEVQVRNGQTYLVSGTDFVYTIDASRTRLDLTIYKEAIASLTISDICRRYFTATFYELDGTTVAHDPMIYVQYDVQNQITMPNSVNTPEYHSTKWFTNQSQTGAALNAGQQTTLTEDTVFYAAYYQSTYNVVDQFVGVQLHFDHDVIPVSDERDTGACRGETGYYAVAKAVYVSMSGSEKGTFCTDPKYQTARARFEAWANANGEHLNTSTYNITSNRINNEITTNPTDSNSSLIIVLLISGISVASLTTLIVIKKRKHH